MRSHAHLHTVALVATLFSLATPGAAMAQVVTSDLDSFLVSETDILPEGPLGSQAEPGCLRNYAEPETSAGLYVQQQGWGVISEASLGDYALISFAGAFETGTSGSCAISQGNIGIFMGDELQAILYTANENDRLIGTLDLRPNDILRIWGGDFLSLPVGDIRLTTAGLVVGAVAAEETFCGATTVPNIYDAPITEARRTLKSAGWKPVPQPPEEFGQQHDLHDQGITEAETCSGTGFGYCSYIYSSAGARLDVTSVGELYEDNVPTVADYAVTCAN